LISIAPDGEFEIKEEYRGKIIFTDQPESYEDYQDDPLSEMVLSFILN
jgi:hypothetical protein